MHWKPAGLLVVVVCAHIARAGVVTPVSSDRLVYALNRETIPQTTNQTVGPSFGLWQAQAYTPNLNAGDPNFNVNGSSVAITASQQSNFGAAGVSYSGFVFVDYGVGVAPNPGASGISRCFTTFHVDGNCPYQLDATFLMSGFVASETAASISLVAGTSGPAIFSMTSSGSQSGVLPTGDYTLKILITGDAFGVSQIGDSRRQIDATFAIPAPSAAVSLVVLCGIVSRRRLRK
jgi:hypothetical protein